MRSIRGHLKFANVISIIALCIALGGTSYAALTLPRNSVTSKQLKPGSVTSSDVKNRSLLRKDFKRGQLRRGAAGPVGPAGAAGPAGARGADGAAGAPGTARAFARVQPNGVLLPQQGDNPAHAGQARDIAQENIDKPAVGVYCIRGLTFDPRSAMVASDNSGASDALSNDVLVSVALERGNGLGGCNDVVGQAPAQIRVVATEVDGSPVNVDKGFVIWLED